MRAKNKKRVQINNGDFIKDLIHVEDCASAIIKSIESSYIGPINIGSGKGIKISTIGKLITKELGYGKLIVKNKKKKLSNDKKNYMVADSTILKKKIKFNFKFDQKKTIKDCCRYWNAN